jgi:hypothetical protein
LAIVLDRDKLEPKLHTFLPARPGKTKCGKIYSNQLHQWFTNTSGFPFGNRELAEQRFAKGLQIRESPYRILFRVSSSLAYLGGLLAASPLSPLLVCSLTSAGLRAAQGSATVAIVTAAGILAPLVKQLHGYHPEMLVLAVCCGVP